MTVEAPTVETSRKSKELVWVSEVVPVGAESAPAWIRQLEGLLWASDDNGSPQRCQMASRIMEFLMT
jgi:hypothetical protein